MASGRETGLARERSSETAAERPVHRRGPNPAAPAGTVAAPAPAAVLHWQRTAGNTAVGSMLRGVQRQPVRTPRPPLGAKAIAAAVTDVSKRYDADSIRFIQAIASQPTTGAFTGADATALATFQTAQGVVPVTGNADEAFVDFLLGKLGAANFAAHDALIHLVADRADLDVSGVLNVRWDPAAVPPPPGQPVRRRRRRGRDFRRQRGLQVLQGAGQGDQDFKSRRRKRRPPPKRRQSGPRCSRTSRIRQRPLPSTRRSCPTRARSASCSGPSGPSAPARGTPEPSVIWPRSSSRSAARATASST